MRGVRHQGVVPAVTSELFGLQHFATNYALTQLGPAAGTQPHPLQQASTMLSK